MIVWIRIPHEFIILPISILIILSNLHCLFFNYNFIWDKFLFNPLDSRLNSARALSYKKNSIIQKKVIETIIVYLGPVPSKDIWSHFYGRCAMCWNEWKINFRIFIFWVIVKIHRTLVWWCHKNDHNSKRKKNRKKKISFDSAHSAYFI